MGRQMDRWTDGQADGQMDERTHVHSCIYANMHLHTLLLQLHGTHTHACTYTHTDTCTETHVDGQTVTHPQ